MKTVDRSIYSGEPQTRWDAVPSDRRSANLGHMALAVLLASGCPRRHACAALKISEATYSRYRQALEALDPDIGSPAWRLAYAEAHLLEAQRDMDRERRKRARDN